MTPQSYKDIVRSEYKKCAADPVHFMKKYCQIQHPKKGKIPFHLYPFQEDVLTNLHDHRYNVILKSRQMGISTLSAGYALWLMTFFSDKNILVIATKQEVAKNLVLKVKVMHQLLPSWLKAVTTEDNKLSLRFSNGSQIKATSATGDSGRSEALSLLIIDEAAFVANIDEIWTSSQQTLATGGGAIILSTPNGTGNFFHKTWVDAEAKKNRFNTIKLKWDLHPDRNQDWRDQQDVDLGVKKAAQECLSGETMIRFRNSETGEEFEISLQDSYKLLQSATNKYQILTPTGWQSFSGIIPRIKDQYVEIKFTDNSKIKCSLEHLFYINDVAISAEYIQIGDVLDSFDSYKEVNAIDTVFDEIELFDVISVSNGNKFIADSLITHNCDCDFITSGNSVIDGELLKWYSETTVCEPIETRGVDGNLWIWEAPNYTKDYIVVADVARGDGGDFSAFHVIDVESITQVAEYKGQISTTEYGNLLVNIATEYNDALLVIENANIGWASIQVAIDRGYRNIYYSPKEGYADVSQQLNRYVDLKDTSQLTPGFTTSSKSRPLIISKLDTYMSERAPIIKSKRLINELQVFIWNGSRAEAQHGYNDDLVMAFAISLWIRDTALKLRQQGIELNKKTLDYLGAGKGVYSNTDYAKRQYGWTMPSGRQGMSEDLTWLVN